MVETAGRKRKAPARVAQKPPAKATAKATAKEKVKAKAKAKDKKVPTAAAKRRKSTKDSEERAEHSVAEEVPEGAGTAAARVARQGPPVILFAHGAGAGSQNEWMQRWKKLLKEATKAVDVVTFDYPYLAGGKRGAPPKAENLVKFHEQQMEALMAAHPGHPVVLCGKSMGSRVGCMVAARKDKIPDAVVCLGYPLKGMNGALRDQTLLAMQAPVIFVQGSKDNMSPLDKLEAAQRKMTVQNELHVVQGGDHSLKVGVKLLKDSGQTQAKVEASALAAIHAFLTEVLPGS